MKISNVNFTLMLGILILFSMCKKEKNNPSTDTPNTGGGVDTVGNGNGSGTTSPRLVSFSPEKGAIGDTISIVGVNFTGNSNNLKASFGNTPARVMSVNTSTTNNEKN